jgi:hypothetical protein
VFAVVADPVGAGYVEMLARPGGNATGFTPFEYSMAGKWLELLKEIAPPCHRGAAWPLPGAALFIVSDPRGCSEPPPRPASR